MSTPWLDALTCLSIEMALTGDRDDPVLHQRQNSQAARLGMSGAEIDAARAGRSFDLRRSRALALALASTDERDEVRERARQAGLCEQACREVERLAGQVRAIDKQ
ncbi:hypothetical protein [Flavisphingomonas formosensis]|uniref:hypothetical protein n=1 Tax=Flavisphingomonas formosensis TaxID=861534 RepID=UPI0012FA1F8F|nr:hypothetical protein [Sphingomonas formosensis]